MDEDNAILTIESAQWEATDSQPEAVRLTTEGRMVRVGDAWVLMYLERAESGMGGTSTTLRVADDGTVALVRQGETTMQMQFSQGRQHLTSMSTPFGVINVGLSTHKVSSTLSPRGGQAGFELHHRLWEPSPCEYPHPHRCAGQGGLTRRGYSPCGT